MNVKYWTTAEIAVLKEVAASPLPLEDQLHRLPGRTIPAIHRVMRRLKLKKATWTRDFVSAAVLGLLKKRDMTNTEIASRLNLSVQWIGPIIRDLHTDGKIHIHAKLKAGACYRTRLWRHGPGDDATNWEGEPEPGKSRAEKKDQATVVVKRDEFTAAFFGGYAA